jgi:uncharacterized membrane protein
MSNQDPNQSGQYPGQGQYGGYNPNQPPQPTDPYAGQQYGGYGQEGPQPTERANPGYEQPGQPGGYQQPSYGQPGQPGGYQQPGYQQPPYGQQSPYNNNFNAGGNPNSTMDLDPKLASGLSYLFGWVSGLIIFLMEKKNRLVRFNAMQSILFSGAYTVVLIVLGVAQTTVPGAYLVIQLLKDIAGLVFFIGWLFCLINGFQGKYFKLPYFGDMAEKYANQGTTTTTF